MFKVVRWFIYYILIEFLILFIMSFIFINNGNDTNLLGNYINNNRIYLVLLLGLIFIPLLYLKYKKINIKENKLKDIHMIIILGISLSLIYNVFGFYLDKFLNSNLYGVFDIKTTLISTVLIGPIIEEYLFRGIIYNEALNKYSYKKSILLTTILFALSHTTIIQIIYAFIIGYILIKIYNKYKNIKSCIIVHMFSNLTTTFITLLLIKDNLVLNLIIFITGLIMLLFIKNKKYDII